jgi:hypothetical protein
MGWAEYTYTHSITPFEDKFILLAGPISTYFFALVLFLLAFLFRKKFFMSMTALILGATQLLDGAPYMLWNSIFSSGGGDFGRFLTYSPDFKILFIILGAIMTFGGLVFLNIYLYKLIRPKIYDINRWYLLGLFFVIQIGGWLTFDWNQLAPGSGFFAPFSSLIVTALILISIGIKNPQYKKELFDNWKIPLIVSWIIGIIILVLTLFWFSKGVAV